MACRLPIVVPKLDTVSHLVKHKNACIFENFQVKHIKECFHIFLIDPKNRKKMGANSEGAVEREYNYRARTEQLMKIYESC
jgi:glycosyltransferase involved in cell wall biosynthesis